MKKVLSIVVLSALLSACGTVGGALSGAGQDLSKVGDWVRNQ